MSKYFPTNVFTIPLIAAIAAVLLLPDPARAQLPEFSPKVVIPRSFPAIEDPPVVSAMEADRWLADDELVLGATVGGQSRAYPINMLTGPRREIINDSLGGRAVAATW